ncbi:MAG: NAD(P)H-dependent oxidoreductase [Flavobacteriales bacterium]|nr:NAD(P)H-dependent oxidoreductase [Flavobacteriales bacterium]
MKNIIALGGSNSKKSINKTFASYVANQIVDVQVTIVDLNDFDLPLYGIDTETNNGIPEDVKRLNSLLELSDGLVISLAEHNGSYSTAFKNAFDWLSRIDKKLWKNKPMLLMATTPGARGGIGVLSSAKMAFPHLGGNIIADFSLPSFYDNFSENGIKDEELNTVLKEKIKIFQEAL